MISVRINTLLASSKIKNAQNISPNIKEGSNVKSDYAQQSSHTHPLVNLPGTWNIPGTLSFGPHLQFIPNASCNRIPTHSR